MTVHLTPFVQSAYTDAIKPIIIGAAAGLSFWFFDQSTGKLAISRQHLYYYQPEIFSSLFSNLSMNARVSILTLESEAVFRVIIHRSIHWVCTQIFEEKEIDLSGYKIRIAPVATSLVSGIFHLYTYKNFHNNFDLIKALGLGILLGSLQEKYGLISALSAHCAINHYAIDSGMRELINNQFS